MVVCSSCHEPPFYVTLVLFHPENNPGNVIFYPFILIGEVFSIQILFLSRLSVFYHKIFGHVLSNSCQEYDMRLKVEANPSKMGFSVQ